LADIDQQPRANLTGREAASKIQAIASSVRTCMFATQLDKYPPDIRPMAIQAVEENGSFWFLSSANSDKNADIASDARVVLTFQDESNARYACLAGQAAIHSDRATIEKYWTAFANNWFDGKDDPRVTVISVRPESGHYWESQNGKILQITKLALGALTGGAIKDDGGIEGELKL
jgi:general stress protein 26